MDPNFWHPFDMSSVLSTARAQSWDVQTAPPVELGRGPRSIHRWFVPLLLDEGAIGVYCTVLMKGTVRHAVPLFPTVEKATTFLSRLGLLNYELLLVPDVEAFVAGLPLDYDVIAEPTISPSGKTSYSKLDRHPDGRAVREDSR